MTQHVPVPTALRHRDRGASVTAMFAAVMVVLLLCVGLVVDGGAQSAARARAEAVATEAARAGAAAAAGADIQGTSGTGRAIAAARAVLANRRMQGSVSVQGGMITVETSTSSSTTFLSLMGVRQLDARGSATARLVQV
ncbi:pilus assembly protein TadG-related protein [Propionibacteriaceae bacterium G57]|uniref:pilus assembly protein TadG-related protein n=1 Tax=Aestuariimicrobium sp. G57 TaxID=3418485 RepID=UPI003DA71CFA